MSTLTAAVTYRAVSIDTTATFTPSWARRDSIEPNSYGNVAGWLAGWLGGWLSVTAGTVLYQND